MLECVQWKSGRLHCCRLEGSSKQYLVIKDTAGTEYHVYKDMYTSMAYGDVGQSSMTVVEIKRMI